MREKAGIFGRVAVFAVILAVIVQCFVQYPFRSTDYRIPQMLEGIKKEPAQTLDCVLVGASNVYTFWNSIAAYEEFGITSWTYAVPGYPAIGLKNLLIEARKAHPDSVYIISLNGFKKDSFRDVYIHNAVDYFPLSANKLDLIRRLCDDAEIPAGDRLEYILPLIRFHSRWSSLEENDFLHPEANHKGAQMNPGFLTASIDQTAFYVETDRREKISDKMQGVLDDLLAYCREEKLQVLFVAMPQALGTEEAAARINYVCDYVEEQGFDVLNQLHETEAIGIDIQTDLKDRIHTNIHGALKYTDYTGKILAEKFDFKDARQDERAASWNASAEEYRSIINPLLYPFELDGSPRDPGLTFPGQQDVQSAGKGIAVVFSAVPGADGYDLFRRLPVKKNHVPTEKQSWHYAGTVVSDGRDGTYEFRDTEEISVGDSFEYSVVAYRMGENGKEYGRCCYSGNSAAAVLDTPVLLGVSIREDGSRELAWSSVDGAESYVVYKKAEGGKYSKVAVVNDGCTYTDAETDQPEIYTVRAACKGSGGDTVYSDYDKEGVRAE